ncbi:MAG: glycosyltransferase family protein [Magnetococcales bacterium]|nr:glycosyltransferase family protein [Magnetococcales bacterium]
MSRTLKRRLKKKPSVVQTHAKVHDRANHPLPDFVLAHYNLGNVFKQQGDAEQAIASFQKAIAHAPQFAEARLNLGSVYHTQGRMEQAQACYLEALRLRPNYPEALINLGLILQIQRHHLEAIAYYQQALALRPDDPEALSRWGVTLQDMGRLPEAMEKYQQALALRPDYPEALSHLGGALLSLDRLPEAMEYLEKSLTLRPHFPEALTNLGSALHKQGRLVEALAPLQKAKAIDPHFYEAHFVEGLTHLLLGDYHTGWPLYEYRWQTRGFIPHGHSQPLWDGSPLVGRTLLLHCEQGIGDNLQFVRYLPAVQEKGGKMILLCPPTLRRLFSRIDGVDTLITPADPIPPCDYQAPFMSLAGLFDTTLATIPAPAPWFKATPSEMAPFREILASRPGFKVGVVWRGNPRYKNDHIRSVTATLLAPLCTVPGCVFVGLQKDVTAAERSLLDAQGQFMDLSEKLHDFADTAAALSCLDLVISVDTAVLHLAGTLARPTWGLLPFVPDWRWLHRGSTAPWYPSVRLFRQSHPGSWPEVIDAVRTQLTFWPQERLNPINSNGLEE